MMRIDIITVLPELIEPFFNASIIKRAKDKNKAEIYIHNLRDWSSGNYKIIDDAQYGGGAGMVMMIEPIDKCISELKSQRSYDEIIYLTPDGDKLTQHTCNQLSMNKNLIFLCGHYKGIDERIRESLITMEISIGDYVLTGGELPAAVLADSIIRLIPGVLNDETSALTDSFQDGLLSHPIYTRPEEYKGMKVPDILLSGNFKEIEKWREEKAIEKTKLKRPDLF